MPTPGRVALRIEQDTPCPDCGYNLRGMRLDSRCPECGRPTIDTFARPLRATDGEFAERLLARPAPLVAGLLLAGIAHDVLLLVPGALGAAVTGGTLLFALVGAWTIWRAQADVRQMRRYKASRTLKEPSITWLLLIVAAAVGLMLLPNAIWFFMGAIVLYAGACLGAVGAAVLGSLAGSKLLQRYGHGHSAAKWPWVFLTGMILALLSAAVPADNARLGLWSGGGLVAGMLLWLVGWRGFVNSLREAQGSVVSLHRRK